MATAATTPVTINEGLIWLKTLRARHAELIALRGDNANTERRYFGNTAEKFKDITPTYDVKKLDKLVTQVATEIRRLEMAIKQANAVTPLVGVVMDDAVLGQVE